jgi:copper(I)-binding protein
VNRALRAATTAVLLVSPLALSACSAGQVTQTATQERDKVGAMGQVGDLTIRQVEFLSPDEGFYEAGDDAELQLAVVNTGEEADTLVEVSGEGFGDVEYDTGSTGSSDDGIEIPGDSATFIGEDALGITLTDLDEALTAGQYLELTFTFENAGEITLRVTVSTPEEALERGEKFDFHHEEGTEEAQEGEQREGGENN